MPVRPKGQKRPDDVVRCTVHIVQIATGEIKEELGANLVNQTKPLVVGSGDSTGKGIITQASKGNSIDSCILKVGKRVIDY